MFDINEYFKTAYKDGHVYDPIICKDGFKVSIQASEHHYCKPRKDDVEYSHVELGFPNMVPPDYILDFVEDPENPLKTVYGFVPVELVNKMIDLHNQ